MFFRSGKKLNLNFLDPRNKSTDHHHHHHTRANHPNQQQQQQEDQPTGWWAKNKSLLRGIEPRSRAWQARILTVKLQEIEIASNRIRTYDLLITSEVPYQLGHRSCFLLVWAPMPWPVLMLCKLPVALYVWCRWYLMDMGVTPTSMVY